MPSEVVQGSQRSLEMTTLQAGGFWTVGSFMHWGGGLSSVQVRVDDGQHAEGLPEDDSFSSLPPLHCATWAPHNEP